VKITDDQLKQKSHACGKQFGVKLNMCAIIL